MVGVGPNVVDRTTHGERVVPVTQPLGAAGQPNHCLHLGLSGHRVLIGQQRVRLTGCSRQHTQLFTRRTQNGEADGRVRRPGAAGVPTCGLGCVGIPHLVPDQRRDSGQPRVRGDDVLTARGECPPQRAVLADDQLRQGDVADQLGEQRRFAGQRGVFESTRGTPPVPPPAGGDGVKASDPVDALPVQIGKEMAADERLYAVDAPVRTDLANKRRPVLEISE